MSEENPFTHSREEELSSNITERDRSSSTGVDLYLSDTEEVEMDQYRKPRNDVDLGIIIIVDVAFLFRTCCFPK